ncbi:uncharacterized protein LOC143671862 [Tamandua tetradactyla]|uniref:uncharacterized protein LOC143671862 n=1 Tax=Tamandua tetradactyla TaxID=48850 RepID=UPI004053F953
MSATEERDPDPVCHDGAGGGVGGNPGAGKGSVQFGEGAAGIVRAAGLLASQAIAEAIWEEEFGQEKDLSLSKKHRDEEEEEERGGAQEEDYEGSEDNNEEIEYQEEDNKEEKEKEEEEDLENDQEVDEEEQDDNEEEVEGSDSQEEDVNEDTEVVTRALLLERLWSLFRDLVRSLLRSIYYHGRIHAWYYQTPLVLRSTLREIEDPAEGPAPQESGNERDRAEAQDGENLSEPEEPEERAVFQEAEAPTAESKDLKSEALADIVEFQDPGTYTYKGTNAGEWRQGSYALRASVGIASSHTGHTQRLPQMVQQRVKALRKLQAQYAQVEAQFYKDLYNLEKKYAALYQPLFDKRAYIINAIYEPTEDECCCQVGVQEGAWEEIEREPEGKAQTKGIPHFWLTAFKNVAILGKLIQENDELILEHLKDVKIKYSGIEEPLRFTLEFVFEANEFFFNEVLTKTYQIQSDPDDSDLFFSRGPEIVSSTGCEIYWKEGGNVSVKAIKPRHCENNKSVVSTSRNVPSYSFFNYFYPSASPEGRVMDTATDFKLGYFFRELLVPKAVLFFTKEASKYEHENPDEDDQEAKSEEEKEKDKAEEPEGPEKDVDPGEGSSRESSWKA